jgi:hypothetical protein
MTEADFIIIATAIAVVGAIIVGVTEHATRRRMARTAASKRIVIVKEGLGAPL